MRLNVACTPGGRLLTVSNSVCGNAFAYDAMDRLTSAATSLSNATYNVTYRRDAGGLVTNLVYASGKTLTRTYDPDGRLVAVSDWLGHTWTFAWDGAGKPTGGAAPGGILSTNHYDAAGRLAAWSTGSAGVPPAPIVGRTITRDLAGLKTRDDITAGPHPVPSFVRYAENTFDAADRLTSASVRYGSHTNAAVSETYLYDGNGALTNLVSGSNAVFSAAYDALGQMSNLDLRQSAQSAVYAYDPLGNRVVSGDAENATLWLPDHADPLKRPLIEAAAATGEPIRYYLWGPGRLLGFIDAASGVLTVAHCDEYGSVVALTDASGAVLHTAYYGPNGQDWGATGTNPTPFSWLGGHGVQRVAVSDHLGPLYLTRYRLYSASFNRFLSADPLGLAGGLNLYAYAEGDPLTYIDPLGLGAEEKGSYLGRSFGQLFKGNYTDDVTGLGTVMQALTGVVNVDLPGDLRDNVYNLTHWNQVSTSQKIIDAVGILPVIGALKYADEAGDVLKGGRKAADAASAAAKNADEVAQAAVSSRATVTQTLSGMKAGRSSGVKVVRSEVELETLYGQLSAGGKNATPPTYKGKMAELPDGTRVGLRTGSTSGGKTIDVFLPGNTKPLKIHVEQ